MKPGRELDALVAEKVMGWGTIKIDRNGNPVGLHPKYPNAYRCHLVKNYSTNISEAWEIVEFFSKDTKNNFSLENCTSDHKYPTWDCKINSAHETGISAPHAICLAALKTVGVDVEES